MATQPVVKVLVDWVNSPIGANATAGSNFTDISAYVVLAAGVNLSRGRQDNISTVQPGRCTFTVDNSDGRFTPGKSTSPYAPGVILGRRVQVSVKDETGTYHVRFDGMISEIDLTETAPGQYTTAQIVCVDVLAQANRFPALSCWTVEYAASLNPLYQYVMNEPQGSPGLKDSAGNGPLLVPRTPGKPPFGGATTITAPAYAYASGNSPVEASTPPITDPTAITSPAAPSIASPLPSVQFSATVPGGGSQASGPSAQFQGRLPTALKCSTGFTIVGWLWPNTAASAGTVVDYTQQAICLSNPRTGAMLSVGFSEIGSPGPLYGLYYSNYLKNSVSPTASYNTSGVDFQQPFMVAIKVSGTTATFYVGQASGPSSSGNNLLPYNTGVVVTSGTFTVPSAAIFDALSIGGPIGGGNGFLGNISNVCIYNSVLTSGEITNLATFGAFGPLGMATGAAAQLATGFAGIPSYWTGTFDTGLSYADYLDITNSNVSTVLQSLVMAEHGVFFADASGKINFYDRSRRMGYGAPALTLPVGSYDVGLSPKWNDQGLVNAEGLQNNRPGVGTVADNAVSEADYGGYPNGTAASPQTAPYYTWVGQTTYESTNGTAGVVENLWNTNQVADAAAWDVNTLGQPGMKLATVSFNMLANSSGSAEYVAPSDLYGVDIGDVIKLNQNLPWWPDAAESGELFIEGVSETYAVDVASIGWYTSPASQGRAWLPGDATYGVLDSTARIGISSYATPVIEINDGPPTTVFTSTMNQGAGGGFVGAADIRTLSDNLGYMIRPPLCFAQQAINTQSLTTGVAAQLVWDTAPTDTWLGLGAYQPGEYLVQLAGWYEVCLTVAFALNTGTQRSAWIARYQQEGTGNQKIAPVSRNHANSSAAGLSTSAVLYCYIGDALSGWALQDSGGSLNTSISNGGSHMSVRYLGNGPWRA